MRLVLEANHQDKEIPYREKGQKVVGKRLIKRGERLTSIRDICGWVGWYERGVFKTPSPKTIYCILGWLENNKMIQIMGTQGNRKETHYKVLNYRVYQDENDAKVTEGKQLLHTNKNDQECKEENNKRSMCVSDDYKIFVDWFNAEFGTRHQHATYEKKVKTRLKCFSVEQLKKASLAMKNDPFMMGKNDRNKVYATLEYITRNDRNVDKYLNEQVGDGGMRDKNKPGPADKFKDIYLT